jgi:tetratricopeptide (TPR) repeat protein
MSPEQAAGDLDALGPRSDVYSLGATLYTLLTGAHPFDGDDVGAVLRRVQAGDFAPPRALDAAIDRALEAVCLKAMALTPEGRYATPRALAEDVERWAADEPVSAWREPPSRRARRWARRHRTAVTGAAAAALAGLVGLAAVAAVQTRANADLTRANAATGRALAETRTAKAATEAALGQSEESRRQAEAVSAFLVDAFRSPDPARKGRDVRVADVLDRAADRLGTGFTGTPATKGALLDALGETYYALGLYDRAAAAFAGAHAAREAALGPEHRDTLKSLNSLAAADCGAGRLAEAITTYERVLKAREATLGPDHLDTLESRNDLAVAYRDAGRPADAAAMLEAAVKAYESALGPDHPDTLVARNNLGNVYRAVGRIAEAVATHEGVLRARERVLAPDHRETLTSRSNLALAYRDAGRAAEAIELGEGILRAREAALGPSHPDMLATRNNLALAYRDAGRVAEAIATFEGVLTVYASTLDPSHPGALTARGNLATTYESLDRWADAERLWRDVVALRRKAGGPLLAHGLNELGRNLLRQTKWSEAEPALREALMIQENAAPDGLARFEAVSLLGGSLLGQGRYAEAEPLVVAGYQGMKAREDKIPAPKKRFLTDAAVRVARLYEGWGKPAEAAAWKERLGLADLPADVFARP